MLGKLLSEHRANIWLINTGWTGGAFGIGKRIKLAHTRAMVNAALAGVLDDVTTDTDPLFGLSIPREVKGVPSEVLNPRKTWPSTAAYDAEAKKLAGMFRENFEQFGSVDSAIRNAGPKGKPATGEGRALRDTARPRLE
jgi:phosphoenolpyruvate carboxykinase (ATP)